MLSFYRIVCRDCNAVIADGWPADDRVQPDSKRVRSLQICRDCEAEALLQEAEDQRRRLVRA